MLGELTVDEMEQETLDLLALSIPVIVLVMESNENGDLEIAEVSIQ